MYGIAHFTEISKALLGLAGRLVPYKLLPAPE